MELMKKMDETRRDLILKMAIAKFRGSCDEWEQKKTEDGHEITFSNPELGMIGSITIVENKELEIIMNIENKNIVLKLLELLGVDTNEQFGETSEDNTGADRDNDETVRAGEEGSGGNNGAGESAERGGE